MAEILHQLRLVAYPIIYMVLYIPGGAGFLPSTVGLCPGAATAQTGDTTVFPARDPVVEKCSEVTAS